MARVLGLSAAATRSGSMVIASRSQSTNTGRAPAWTMAFAVAAKVIGVVMTSSPGPIPQTSIATWSAAVHDERATASPAPLYAAKACSKRATRGPVPIQPERSVSTTSSISACSMAGLPKTRKLSRRPLPMEMHPMWRGLRPLRAAPVRGCSRRARPR